MVVIITTIVLANMIDEKKQYQCIVLSPASFVQDKVRQREKAKARRNAQLRHKSDSMHLGVPCKFSRCFAPVNDWAMFSTPLAEVT